MSMEAIITWAKENYNLISLGVGVLGVLIGIISVIQAKRQVKQAKKEQEASLKQSHEQNIRQEIAKKRAELKVLKSTYHVVDSKTIDDINLRKSILSSEIEELEKQL